MISLTKDIWKREGPDSISAGLYSLLISLFITIKLVFITVILFLFSSFELNILIIMSCFIIFIILLSLFFSFFQNLHNFLIFSLGFFILILWSGIIFGENAFFQNLDIIINIMILTSTIILSTTIGALGLWLLKSSMFGKVIGTLAGFLFAGVLFFFLIKFIEVRFLDLEIIKNNFLVFEYFGALFLSLYFWLRWDRGMHLPRNVNNAIDVSSAIFLDIITPILNIFGGLKDILDI